MSNSTADQKMPVLTREQDMFQKLESILQTMSQMNTKMDQIHDWQKQVQVEIENRDKRIAENGKLIQQIQSMSTSKDMLDLKTSNSTKFLESNTIRAVPYESYSSLISEFYKIDISDNYQTPTKVNLAHKIANQQNQKQKSISEFLHSSKSNNLPIQKQNSTSDLVKSSKCELLDIHSGPELDNKISENSFKSQKPFKKSNKKLNCFLVAHIKSLSVQQVSLDKRQKDYKRYPPDRGRTSA